MNFYIIKKLLLIFLFINFSCNQIFTMDLSRLSIKELVMKKSGLQRGLRRASKQQKPQIKEDIKKINELIAKNRQQEALAKAAPEEIRAAVREEVKKEYEGVGIVLSSQQQAILKENEKVVDDLQNKQADLLNQLAELQEKLERAQREAKVVYVKVGGGVQEDVDPEYEKLQATKSALLQELDQRREQFTSYCNLAMNALRELKDKLDYEKDEDVFWEYLDNYKKSVKSASDRTYEYSDFKKKLTGSGIGINDITLRTSRIECAIENQARAWRGRDGLGITPQTLEKKALPSVLRRTLMKGVFGKTRKDIRLDSPSLYQEIKKVDLKKGVSISTATPSAPGIPGVPPAPGAPAAPPQSRKATQKAGVDVLAKYDVRIKALNLNSDREAKLREYMKTRPPFLIEIPLKNIEKLKEAEGRANFVDNI